MTELSILTAPETLAAIQRHAVNSYPLESCGVVTKDGFTPLPNRHAQPNDYFDCSEDAAELQIAGTLLGVVHSHTTDMRKRSLAVHPSSMDMRQQIAMDVPWALCSASAQSATTPFWWGPGIPRPGLVGRRFRHGPSGSDGRGDCYALVRDYYAVTYGLDLPDYPRDWGWWNDEDSDLYEEGFREAGFSPIAQADVRPGDAAMMMLPVTDGQGRALRARVIHAAIYLGDSTLLHHRVGRLSMLEPINDWIGSVKYWVRHDSAR